MVQDYQDFADVNSFQDRVDLHHIVLSDVQAGTFYVAVYNNDAYFKVSSSIREAIGRSSAATLLLIWYQRRCVQVLLDLPCP